MRAGSLLGDSVVAASEVIHLGVEGLEHVLEVGEVVRGWVVWGGWHLLSQNSKFLVYRSKGLLDVINITRCTGSGVAEILEQLP